MKDKRILLKLGALLETVYIILNFIYYFSLNKINDEVIANIFLLAICAFFAVTLYKESKRDINELKKSKAKIIISSIWLFLTNVIPGLFGFAFLLLISDKKDSKLPLIKESPTTMMTYVKSISLLVIFILVMFVLPKFSFFSKIPSYVIYVLMFIITLVFNYKDLKKDLKYLAQNFKIYFPFIIKRYFSMLVIMIIVAIPVVLINNGATSTNQEMINSMFDKLPLATLILSTLYAPFVEESIFRLSLSKLFKNKTLFIIISGVLFGTLHVIDKFTSIYDFLYIFQYATLGICLAKAYKDSNNIFVSMLMHFIQNFLAAILVLLLY